MDLVPEEAMRAAVRAALEHFEMPFMASVRDFTGEQVRAGELRAADEEADRKNRAAIAAVVEAAAPLILAAELDRLGDQLVEVRDAMRQEDGRTLRSSALAEGIRAIRARASVLRGEGDPK